jgi:hypothetical protein
MRGLSFSDIDENWKLALDAENIFWSVLPGNNGDFLLPDNIIELIKKKEDILIQRCITSGSMNL